MMKQVYRNVCLTAFTFFLIMAVAIVLNGNVALADAPEPCVKGAFFYPESDITSGEIVILGIERDSSGNLMQDGQSLTYDTVCGATNWRHLFIDFKFYDSTGTEDKSVTDVAASDFQVHKVGYDEEGQEALLPISNSAPELKLVEITFSTVTVDDTEIIGDGKTYINVVAEEAGHYRITYTKDGSYKNKSVDFWIGAPSIALYSNNDTALKQSSRVANSDWDIIEYDHTKPSDLNKNEYYLIFNRDEQITNTSVSMEAESRYIDESNIGEYKVEKTDEAGLIYKVTVPANRKGTFLLKFDVKWNRPQDSDNAESTEVVEETRELRYLFADTAALPSQLEDKRPKLGFSGMLIPRYDYDNNGSTCWDENPRDIESGYTINYDYPKYWVHADTIQGVLDILAEIATTGKDSGAESGLPADLQFDTKLEYYVFLSVDTSAGGDADKNAMAIQNVKPNATAFKGVFFTAEDDGAWTWPELYLDATVPIKVGAKSDEQLNIHAGFPAGATASDCNPISIVRREVKKDEDNNEYNDWQSEEEVKKIVAESTETIPGVEQEAYEIPQSVETGIQITTPPAKTTYMEGENFDSTGMVVEIMCNDGKSKIVTEYTVTVASPLTTDVKEVVITYSGHTAIQPIQVTALPAKGDAVNATDDKGVGIYTVTKAGTLKDGKVEGAEVSFKPVKGTTKIVIPEKVTDANGVTYAVTSIDKNAFKNNKKITSITINNSIKKIDNNTFNGCTKLKTVTIGKNVTSIGNKAFCKCTSLTKITIPNKVTKIGKQAFDGCKKLKTITLKTKKLKSVGSKAINGINKKATIKVPDKKTLAKYKKLFKSKQGFKKTMKIKK